MALYSLKPKHKLKLNKLYKQIDTLVTPLSIKGAKTKEPMPFDQREKGEFVQYNIGDSWGELFDCAWFNLQAKIPKEYMEKALYLKLDFNCELCLFNEEGLPVKGFTNKSSQFDFKLGRPTKRYFQVNDFILSDGTVNLWIDAGMNDLFGEFKKKGKIACAEIVSRNDKIRTLHYDLETLLAVNPRKAGKALKLALKKGEIDQALEITSELLKKDTTNQHKISAIGHAHIDLAWLWPIRETKRKAARTFANVLYLMDRYPDFKFGASQPQLYQWVKEDYPQLYQKICEKIKEGRWEVQGGMWVESDTNVPNGESLVRQMLFGIRYFQEEFGIRVKSLWLPDVFGYNGNLPQIIKKSGLDYFMTIKISWNRTNKFPYHTFTWKAIDGTSVFAHMPPEGTYNSPINAKFASQSQTNYQEKKIGNHTLNLFGIGDGGGGPGAEHLERLKRIANLDPLPQVKQELSSNFYDDLAKDQEKYPTYQGELYLEYHRGTYTSQSQNKYYNRKIEQKLKTLETMLVHLKKHEQYKAELGSIWKEILLYQFHDILPGSSIKRVYDECVAAYEKIYRRLDKILEEALGSPLITDAVAENNCVYNPLHQEVNVQRFLGGDCIEFTVQALSDNTTNLNIYHPEVTGETDILENNLLKIKFNSDGGIDSIFDKELQIEVLSSTGNDLKVYGDSGNGWNIRSKYWLQKAAKPTLTENKHYRCGPMNYIEQYYTYRNSTIIQRIMLHPDSKLVEFDTELDWQTPKKMLRTAFPLNLTTDHVVCDIQFGTLNRSTGNKTKIEKARWEVPAQKWVDMSKDSFGAAVITDCKYGYRLKNNIIDLNLLRATDHPGKEGDIGKHKIRYAFYVHAGDHIQGEVDWHATVFDTWFPIYAKSKLKEPLLSISEKNIQYSTIKTAEDDGSIIIRLYESIGKEPTIPEKLTALYVKLKKLISLKRMECLLVKVKILI